MMARRSGMFFYADAWRSDVALQACSEGTCLLWFKMLLIMNEGDERGILKINSLVPTSRQIAGLGADDLQGVLAS